MVLHNLSGDSSLSPTEYQQQQHQHQCCGCVEGWNVLYKRIVSDLPTVVGGELPHLYQQRVVHFPSSRRPYSAYYVRLLTTPSIRSSS